MIRISVTGPESTGKSWLAGNLAAHYRSTWVPEFAREYLENINRPYTYEDILVIAQNQFAHEESHRENTDLLFCDTDFCVTSIWCEVKYGKCHDWITDHLAANNYDLYLLCDIDLPWQYDPLREHPEMRSELFDMYMHVMKKYNYDYHIISGFGDDRLQNAIRFIDSRFNF